MSDELLVFDGVRWPHARITRTSPILRKFVDDRGTQPEFAYDFAPEGDGRRYHARGPAGWWRDFVDMMRSNDQAAVLAFLARRGDPAGLMEQAALNAARARLGQPLAEDPKPGTMQWSGLQSTLGGLAHAWAAPDSAGISRIDPARWSDADVGWRQITSVWWLNEIELVPDPKARHPFILRPKTLAAYMAISGASSLYRKARMRTCARCGSWFEVLREHGKFCSMSCRSMAHAGRRT